MIFASRRGSVATLQVWRAISSASTLRPNSRHNSLPGATRPALPVLKLDQSCPFRKSIAGNWSGQLTQVGSQSPYKFELAISAKGAETKFPTSIAQESLHGPDHRNPMSSFVEIITKGQADKGGRCSGFCEGP